MTDLASRRRHIGVTAVIVVMIAGLLAGCGSIPNNSSPQPITSFDRQGPTNPVPVPSADMDPEALVRAFLKATSDPQQAHRAARNFLTPTSARQWDDQGDMVILDEINIFVDQRSADAVRLRLIGDNAGTLRSDGELLPATGRVETTLSLVRSGDQWRIDGPLPNGTMIDRNRFDAAYNSELLYFTDRTRQRLIPDPRWLYAGSDAGSTTLVQHLIDGPADDLKNAVDSAFPNGAQLRGAVTAVSGGGVQVDLTNIGSPPIRDRTVLAAQIIWTLSGANIGGPYVINADGSPLIPERSAGWQTTDVRGFDPNATPTTDVGLNVIRGGALERVTNTAAMPVTGPLGSSRSVRSAAISPDGKRVASVSAGTAPGIAMTLGIGDYGGAAGTVVTGASILRPSFGADQNTVWAVVDGNPVQWNRAADGSSERVAPADAASIATVARGPITEMQIAPDGVRVALIVGGQVVFAVVTSNDEGALSLSDPRIAAYNIGNEAVSLDWASPTTLMIARTASDSPVVQLSINGTPAVGLLSGNLSPPVRAVVADRTTVYAADTRGVLRLGSTNGQPDQYWTEVEQAMEPGEIPVLP